MCYTENKCTSQLLLHNKLPQNSVAQEGWLIRMLTALQLTVAAQLPPSAHRVSMALSWGVGEAQPRLMLTASHSCCVSWPCARPHPRPSLMLQEQPERTGSPGVRGRAGGHIQWKTPTDPEQDPAHQCPADQCPSLFALQGTNQGPR